MKKFKILSIDGGGIRGIIPCVILKELEKKVGRQLFETFHLMAGTSTGGIIALGLATPRENGFNTFDTGELLDLYVDHGHEIFKERDREHSWAFNLIEIIQRPYKSDKLEALFQKKFREVTLKQCLTDVFITSYDIHKGRPFYFSTRFANEDPENENFRIKNIARATSAAPTYFEPTELVVNKFDKQKLALIDGGVLANNPAILAYTEAKELYKRMPTKGHSPKHDEVTSNNVTADDDDYPFFMLSIGTGTFEKSYPIDKMKQVTAKDWIKPLLTDIFMRSVSENTHYVMHHLLPPYKKEKHNDESIPEKLTPKDCRYWRIDINIDEKSAKLDNTQPDNIAALQEKANEYVRTHQDELNEIAAILRDQ